MSDILGNQYSESVFSPAFTDLFFFTHIYKNSNFRFKNVRNQWTVNTGHFTKICENGLVKSLNVF